MKKKQRILSERVRMLYCAYFDTKVDTASWAPQYSCASCVSRLSNWCCTGYQMPFGVPMIWRELLNHADDCYFCCTEISLTGIRTGRIKYPNIRSASRPVMHSNTVPVPRKPEHLFQEQDSDSETNFVSEDKDFIPEPFSE